MKIEHKIILTNLKVGDKIISTTGNKNKTGTIKSISNIYCSVHWDHLTKINFVRLNSVEKIEDKRDRIINELLQ